MNVRLLGRGSARHTPDIIAFFLHERDRPFQRKGAPDTYHSAPQRAHSTSTSAVPVVSRMPAASSQRTSAR